MCRAAHSIFSTPLFRYSHNHRAYWISPMAWAMQSLSINELTSSNVRTGVSDSIAACLWVHMLPHWCIHRMACTCVLAVSLT